MHNSVPPPPGWANDSLTQFFDDAHRNRFATFANKGGWSRRLIDLDACFMRIAKDWVNPRNLLLPFFFFRCHSAYRAACENSMAGQVTDAYPQVRTALEYAGYALHIHKNPSLAEKWLRRHDDDSAMAAVRREFTVANVRSTVRTMNKHAATVFAELYERAIDFGGHPNERAITGSMTITELDGGKRYDSIYLHGDDLMLDQALKTTAQAGVCSLEVLQDVFPERFELLGVRATLLELRKGL